MLGPLAAGQAVLWLIERGHLPVDALPAIVQAHWQGLQLQAGRLWTILTAATVMLILGLIDDLRGLGWQTRLAVQALVALVLVACQDRGEIA